MNLMMKIGIGCGVFALLTMFLFMSSCTSIQSGSIGVRMTFGKVHSVPLEPGLHFVYPLVDSVVKLDTRLQTFPVKAEAASKDMQVVHATISVQHSLTTSSAPASYQTVGDLERFDLTVIAPAVMESFKATTAKYTAEELITKRDVVKQQAVSAIQTFIDDTLVDKGIPGAIHVSNMAISDFQFSREFNMSIESKVKAQQEALRAANEKQKRITEAEASAKEIELAADAQAYKIEKESIQRAASIERESLALAQNPLLIQLRAIERWNGQVPTFSGAGSMVPFLDMSQITKKE